MTKDIEEGEAQKNRHDEIDHRTKYTE